MGISLGSKCCQSKPAKVGLGQPGVFCSLLRMVHGRRNPGFGVARNQPALSWSGRFCFENNAISKEKTSCLPEDFCLSPLRTRVWPQTEHHWNSNWDRWMEMVTKTLGFFPPDPIWGNPMIRFLERWPDDQPLVALRKRRILVSRAEKAEPAPGCAWCRVDRGPKSPFL